MLLVSPTPLKVLDCLELFHEAKAGELCISHLILVEQRPVLILQKLRDLLTVIAHVVDIDVRGELTVYLFSICNLVDNVRRLPWRLLPVGTKNVGIDCGLPFLQHMLFSLHLGFPDSLGDDFVQ